MEKVIRTIPMQSTTTGTLLLPILTAKCLRSEVIHPITKKLKYLISTPIHGQKKVNFPFAQIGKKIYDHLFYRLINFYENIRKHFSIFRYAVVSRKSSVLIFGGQCDDERSSSRIAKYTLNQWTDVGNLKAGRYAPSAISNGNRIYVVGGDGTRS